MSYSTLIRWSGLANIAGGVVIVMTRVNVLISAGPVALGYALWTEKEATTAK